MHVSYLVWNLKWYISRNSTQISHPYIEMHYSYTALKFKSSWFLELIQMDYIMGDEYFLLWA